MKQKRISKKLNLGKVTISELSGNQLDGIRGMSNMYQLCPLTDPDDGQTYGTCYNTCIQCNNTPGSNTCVNLSCSPCSDTSCPYQLCPMG